LLREIIFTGSATEANNLAVRGVISQLGDSVSKLISGSGLRPHMVTTTIEHKSILEPIRDLEDASLIDATYVKPNKEGIINPQDVAAALRSETILVSIMYANNEIGTIQPIAQIARIIKNFREANNQKNVMPLFHTDAVQAAGYLDMGTDSLGVDLLTISGHKIYGPKGIGALYIREGIKIKPLIMGGGQEYGMRSGTESVPLIVGLGKAVEILDIWKNEKANCDKLRAMRDDVLEQLLNMPNIQLNGSREDRLPNNINISIASRNAADLLIKLSEAGICISAGSACQARGQKASHVLKAIGGDAGASFGLRVTLGKYTTKKELDFFLRKMRELLN